VLQDLVLLLLKPVTVMCLGLMLATVKMQSEAHKNLILANVLTI